MKKPNLFILGAPKCGTTALASWLASHPAVYVAPVKEPHFFSDDYRLTRTIAQYERLFAPAPSDMRWACEASVWHLFSASAVPNILEYAPDAKFVVMVRNPVDMAVSLHEQQRFNGNELFDDIEDALAAYDARARGGHAGVRKGYRAPEHLAYYASCALGWQVRRLFDRVARDRVHVIVFDDLASDSASVYRDLLSFLGLPHVSPEAFERVNSAKRRKSFWLDALVLRAARFKSRMGVKARLGLLARLRKWNVVYRPRPPVPVALREQMAAKFHEDVELLGSLIERDLSAWRHAGR